MGGLLRPDGSYYSYDPEQRERELIEDGMVVRKDSSTLRWCLIGSALLNVALLLSQLL